MKLVAFLCVLGLLSGISGVHGDRKNSSPPPTPMQLTLATLLAGQYSNREQNLQDIANNVTGLDFHFWLQFNYVPVVIDVLSPAVTFYYEQIVNNGSTPSRQEILAFTQETPARLRQKSYSIVNASRFSVTPEGLLALKDLQLSELSTRPECDAFLEPTSKESFTSFLATPRDCTFPFFGQEVFPEGTRDINCSGIELVEVFRAVDDGTIVAGTLIPYDLVEVSNIYPVPVQKFRSIRCFDVPCTGKTNQGGRRGPSWNEIKLEMTYSKYRDGQDEN